MRKVRESNFELMRIISMVFIVLWHIICHGNIIGNCKTPEVKSIFLALKYIFIVHVNSFVILMGYFQCNKRFKLSKIMSLIFQIVFYSITVFLFLYIFGFIEKIDLTMIIGVLIPVSAVDYWFVASYLITYILSDYVNDFINSSDQRGLKKFLILCFVIFSIIPFLTGMRLIKNDGYNFFHFIFLYIVGAYLNKYPLKNSRFFDNMSLNGYRIFVIFLFFLCSMCSYLLYDFGPIHNFSGNLFTYITNVLYLSQDSYASPIVIVQTICYFEFFKTLKIKSKIVNLISSCVFGIYLFHENTYLRIHLYKILKIDNGGFYGRRIFIDAFIAFVIIFTIGIVIELIRKLFAKIIVKTSLYKKTRIACLNFIKSFDYGSIKEGR